MRAIYSTTTPTSTWRGFINPFLRRLGTNVLGYRNSLVYQEFTHLHSRVTYMFMSSWLSAAKKNIMTCGWQALMALWRGRRGGINESHHISLPPQVGDYFEWQERQMLHNVTMFYLLWGPLLTVNLTLSQLFWAKKVFPSVGPNTSCLSIWQKVCLLH